MTLLEALDICRSVTLRNPAFPIELTADINPFGTIDLRARTAVPCRDSGERIWVTHGKAIPVEHLRGGGQLLFLVKEFVRDVFVHEFKECFHVDGVRVDDPHRGEL